MTTDTKKVHARILAALRKADKFYRTSQWYERRFRVAQDKATASLLAYFGLDTTTRVRVNTNTGWRQERGERVRSGTLNSIDAWRSLEEGALCVSISDERCSHNGALLPVRKLTREQKRVLRAIDKGGL